MEISRRITEEARAGEQGRGIAVVTDELRKLTERTTKATVEIASMIKGIHEDISGAVTSMEETTHHIDTDAQSNDLLQLVGFRLGNEEYGIDILKVQEINRIAEITKIRQSPDFVEGVINLRGNVIPIIDLRKRFHMPEREHDKQTRIVVGEIEGRTVGLIADAVSEVIRLPSNTIEPAPKIISNAQADYIKGVGKLEDRLLMLLDIELILTGADKEKLFEVADA